MIQPDEVSITCCPARRGWPIVMVIVRAKTLVKVGKLSTKRWPMQETSRTYPNGKLSTKRWPIRVVILRVQHACSNWVNSVQKGGVSG